MKKKWVYISVLSLCIISISAYRTIEIQEVQQPIEETYQLKEVQYHTEGIEAYYPQIISGASPQKIKIWNEIITDDFNKILQLYSYDPYPENIKLPFDVPTANLTINYEVMLLNNQFFSIIYTATFINPYSAHPTELVYTTNIDTKKDIRLTLSDLILLNLDFVNSLKDWNFTTADPNNVEWNQAIKDIIKNLSDEFLLQGLEAADQIGSGNPLGIYTFLTPNKLSISISVPNFVGDHVEFEKDYSELRDYLNPNYEWSLPLN